MQDSKLNIYDVAVVVPVYQKEPKEKELACFVNNCKIFKNRHIYLAAPEGLNLETYHKIASDLKVELFKPEYFNSIKGYNRLMLSDDFYSRFKSYKFILICQLDVFAFKDDLDRWIIKDYDYVGAPWVDRFLNIFTYVAVKTNISKALKLIFSSRKINNSVGNGGFSLRKTDAFLKSLMASRSEADQWPANEDFYWSFFAQLNHKPFHVPNYIEAAEFCIELKPAKMIKLLNNKLPMGLHAWERYDKEFWNATLKQHRYES